MNFVEEILLASGILLGILLIVSLLKKEQSEGLKVFLFLGMIVPVAFTTIYLAGVTIAENSASVTRGPVHWHADFQICACGQKIDLVKARGLANRIGTSLLHEHGDDRIHVEGTVRDLSDVSLSNFFRVVGGDLGATFMRLPTNEGELVLQNDEDCSPGNPGTLQVFVYQTREGIVRQQKLEDFSNYVLSPSSTIPPGDCIIFEFEPEIKNRTDKICNFYKIALQKGELKLQN